jgi:contractile injection system tube protein
VSNPVDGVERAQLVRKTGQETTLEVHFNPASLQYTITNTLQNTNSGNSTKQHVSQSSGKLTFDLVFDTTDTGADVRSFTQQVAKLMEPEDKVPPVVSFEWGGYQFQGVIESYKETTDFFSANGVPLRSMINLTLAKQDEVFPKERSATTTGTLSPDAIQVPSAGGAAGVGAQGGDPRAARGIAAANGEESLRFPSSDSFAIGDAVPLAPPVAFATGGGGGGLGLGGGLSAGISGGFGVSGGAGIGISGGFGLSGGAGTGISGGLSGGISGGVSVGAVFGGKASARVTAAAGAFAGLRVSVPGRRLDRLRVDLLQPRPESSSLGTDEEASFQLGGQASVEGSVSLRADVAGSARIRFD